MDLKDKKILVTGGGGIGVGAGICQALVESGAQVFLNEITLARAEEACTRYPGAIPIGGDVSQPDQVEAMFAQLLQDHGPLNGLVNNAGVGLTKHAHESSVTEFQRLYQINVQGLWQMSRAFARQLVQAEKTGNIVNVSSVHSLGTAPRYAIYSSAKHAVNGLTRGMAVELGIHGIRVNAIAPGYVHAEQNYDLIRAWTAQPEKWVEGHTHDQQVLRHEIDPIDCGHAVAFLLSDYSRSITGQVLQVDNGMTLTLYNNTFLE